MPSELPIAVVFGPFAVLLGVAWWITRGASEQASSTGERRSLWWAFGRHDGGLAERCDLHQRAGWVRDGIRERGWSEARRRRIRRQVHLLFAVVLLGRILGFHWLESRTVLRTCSTLPAYAPLPGLYAFGLRLPARQRDGLVPLVCLLAVLVPHTLKR